MKASSTVYAALLIPMLWISGMQFAQAQSSRDAVSVIRQRYATINQNLARYKTVKKELLGFSTEGGELIAYSDGAAVRKIVARYQGEGGRALEEYYYWDDELVFVYRKEDSYSEPMSGKVTRSAESRFYFESGELIRWLGDKGTPMRRGSDQFAEQQRTYLRNSQLFLNGARSGKATIEAPE